MSAMKTYTPLAAHEQRQFCCRCQVDTDTYATVTLADSAPRLYVPGGGPTRRFHACVAHAAQLP